MNEAFNVDNEFHRLLCRISGFPDIWQTIHNATGQLDRVRRRGFPKIGYFDEVIAEHVALSTAIKARDEDEAVTLLRRHLSGISAVIEYVVQTDADAISGKDHIALLNGLEDL